MLKKRYRIVWITESWFGFKDCIVAHEIIETPAQYTFNLLVDMLTYNLRVHNESN